MAEANLENDWRTKDCACKEQQCNPRQEYAEVSPSEFNRMYFLVSEFKLQHS